jgi:hypothetical protein
MIVEILGLPGSGKTSIVNKMRACNNSQDKINFLNRRCTRRNGTLKICLFYIKLFFLYPKIILNIKSSFWLLAKISLRLCHYKSHIKEELCVLSDTGILMPIISFIIQHNKYLYKVDLRRLISSLSLPDVIVFIDSDINIVIDRYVNRGGVQTKGVGIRDVVTNNSELYENFLLGFEALSDLKSILKEKKCAVIMINNNDSAKYNEIPAILFHKLVSEFRLSQYAKQ